MQAILTVVLICLISSCKTTVVTAEKVDETDVRETLVEYLPEAPKVPQFPALHWTYDNGLYSLDEAGVDKLLLFKEETLPNFVVDYEAWQREVVIVLNNLI